MPHSPKLGNPPPIGTPLDAPEWLAWKREIATWYYAIIADLGTEPWRSAEGGSKCPVSQNN